MCYHALVGKWAAGKFSAGKIENEITFSCNEKNSYTMRAAIYLSAFKLINLMNNNFHLASAFSSNLRAIKNGSNENSLLNATATRRTQITGCPLGRTEKKTFQVPPNGNYFTEVSYMSYSSQLYGGKAAVVW